MSEETVDKNVMRKLTRTRESVSAGVNRRPQESSRLTPYFILNVLAKRGNDSLNAKAWIGDKPMKQGRL
jgi:hypothetical protein